MNRKLLIDYYEVRNLFDKKFKETMQLIQAGETHLDNLAEGFTEADRVLLKLLLLSPQTNADRIRAMSDEELAKFRAGGHCPPSRRFPDCATIKPCSKCWLEYLRQPVKDGDNE